MFFVWHFEPQYKPSKHITDEKKIEGNKIKTHQKYVGATSIDYNYKKDAKNIQNTVNSLYNITNNNNHDYFNQNWFIKQYDDYKVNDDEGKWEFISMTKPVRDPYGPRWQFNFLPTILHYKYGITHYYITL